MMKPIPPELVAEFAFIREGLQTLRLAPSLPKIFGEEGHHFELNPVLTADEITRFEAEHAVQLPVEYGAFLTTVGNGGDGPFWGLFKFGETDDGWGMKRWKENDGFVGTLSNRFPFTAAWNDLTGRPKFDESRETDQAYEDNYWAQVRDWEEANYWNPRFVNGAIPICHLGCAYRDWLVITGPEAGNVWRDLRADYQGLTPVQARELPRVSFLHWYRFWLEDALALLPNSEQPG